MTMTALREHRVSWPIPNVNGNPSCPLCGLSAKRFRGDEFAQVRKLERHIAKPHARCRDCLRTVGTHRMEAHRQRRHRFPTMVIPGLESVA